VIRAGRRLPSLLVALGFAVAAAPSGAATPRFPDILLVTIDTLRADHLSGWGYARPTSPAIDRLAAAGLRLDHARTIEPLTTPALASLLTSVPPHVHGATRNGLPIRGGLASLPLVLAKRGYRTAAFVGNWTLKDGLSGLAEHWGTYEAMSTRKRWFGLLKSEAVAPDLTDAALDWVEEQREEEPNRPFFLWVHYVEPHEPYRFHPEFAGRLGIEGKNPGPIDRYDTEIAFTDAEVGRLVEGLDRLSGTRDRLTVFTVDHGEAFGEHGQQGHGRILHEPTLRVPLSLTWPRRIQPATSHAAVTLLDVAPTVLSLLGLPAHPYFRGTDFAPLADGDPVDLPAVCLQAHKGAVQSVQREKRARRAGLLEVGRLDDETLEIVHVAGRDARRHFDLRADPKELHSDVPPKSAPSEGLAACLEEVQTGLAEADRFVPPDLDDEAVEHLRNLGYLD